MKKTTIILIIVAALAAVVFWGVGIYNALVTAEENVETSWAQVENNTNAEATLFLIW